MRSLHIFKPEIIIFLNFSPFSFFSGSQKTRLLVFSHDFMKYYERNFFETCPPEMDVGFQFYTMKHNTAVLLHMTDFLGALRNDHFFTFSKINQLKIEKSDFK